ncbi:MAG TPA: AAA family ATPase [Stellaceae bacterium]|nr:AAA family ATPase [Stellaceae bacterium]
MPDQRTIRIFISSPADVRPERLKAEQIVARLNREFAYHFRVEALLWEREPLVALHHPQDPEHLPRAGGTDIVVVILWSRLGVLLPADRFRGAISGRPVTGTEWEFEDALASARQRGVPDLLLYRKTAEPVAGLGDLDAVQERLEQVRALDDFFYRWFRSEDDKSFTAALHAFADTAEFENRLYDHLRELLERRAGGRDREVSIRWHQAPFRGLLSFEHEHAPVFFGRTRARNELRELLAQQEANGRAFVLVLGASGSGKSSLVKAGLLTDLKLPGMISRVGLCRHAILRPSDRPRELLARLASALLEETALPELVEFRYSAERLEALLRKAPETVVVPIEQGLMDARQKANLTETAEARLAIIIDQFEELFTVDGLAAEERDRFVAALDAMARSGLVWVVAMMRSDFYDRLETVPAIAQLVADEACYRLMPPDDSELGQIILQPAREAGLRFGYNAHLGISLDEVIRQAAARERGALPLLSFLLDQLWQRRSEDGELTFAAYEELGRLEGALGRRAEEVFLAQPEDVQAALPRLLPALVTIGQGVSPLVAARTASLDRFPAGSPERRLIDAFLAPEARLLVIGEAEGSTSPRVRVAHEALLTHWERARDWIAERPADLQLEERLEAEAARWTAAPDRDKPSLLLPTGLPLSEAEDLLARRRDELRPAICAFVAASSRKARRRQRLVTAAAGLFAILAAGATAAGIIARNEEVRAERTLDAAKQAVNVIVVDVASGLRNVEGMQVDTIRGLLQKIEETVEHLTSESPSDAALARLELAMLDEFTSTYMIAGDLDRAGKSGDRMIALARGLVAAYPADPDWKRFLAMGLNRRGEVDFRRGDAAGAFAAFSEALEGMRSLAQRYPNNGLFERDMSASFMGIGDVKLQAGDDAGARAAYESGLAISRRLAEREPNNLELQRDLSMYLVDVGDMKQRVGDTAAALAAYQEALTVSRRLTKQAPGNAQWQRDLFVGLTRVADLEVQAGERPAASSHYDEALAIIRRLSGRDPGNSQLLWDMAGTVTKIGDVKLGVGDFNAALANYEQALSIMRNLAGRDQENARWQRDLSVSLNKVGSLRLRNGDAAGALAAYEEALKIVRALAARDPANTSWLRDLSISLSYIGDLKLRTGDARAALANYQPALKAVRRLSESDPGNTDALRDLCVTLNKVGDAELAAGDGSGAATDYEQALATARKLAERDAHNLLWRRDLAITLNKYGDVKLRLGDTDAALAAYKESVAIVRDLAEHDPGNAQWQTDLAIGLYKLATVETGEERKDRLNEALAILDRLDAQKLLSGDQAKWPALLRQMLAKTETP